MNCSKKNGFHQKVSACIAMQGAFWSLLDPFGTGEVTKNYGRESKISIWFSGQQAIHVIVRIHPGVIQAFLILPSSSSHSCLVSASKRLEFIIY